MDGLDAKLIEGLALLEDEDGAYRGSSGAAKGGSNTGPKGVLADYRNHQAHLREAAAERRAAEIRQFDSSGLRSGWLQRTIEAESFAREEVHGEDEESADELIRQLEEEEEEQQGQAEEQFSRGANGINKLVNLTQSIMSKLRPNYGQLIRIESDQEYLESIERHDPEQILVVHLTRPQVVESRLASQYLAHLAIAYPGTKFIEYSSRDLEIPNSMFPVILAYRAAEVVANLIGEVNGGVGGFFECDEIEGVLLKTGVLQEQDRVD